jgi:RND superfamily putative drug exporter
VLAGRCSPESPRRVLAFVFGSASRCSCVGMLAVVGGIAATFALSHTTDVSQYALNIVTLIGLGVAIDYSLLLVTRWREELAAGHESGEAVTRAMATAGRSIAYSGITVDHRCR